VRERDVQKVKYLLVIVSFLGVGCTDEPNVAQSEHGVGAKPNPPLPPPAIFDAGLSPLTGTPNPPAPPGPPLTREDIEELYFARHVARASLIVIATADNTAPTEVLGEYPTGETEPMLEVAVSVVRGRRGRVTGSSLRVLFNDTRKPPPPGASALLMLVGTPSGHLFVLKSIPLKSPDLPPALDEKIERYSR
jgi:hypothetical protein